jgi:hypothetical protein
MFIEAPLPASKLFRNNSIGCPRKTAFAPALTPSPYGHLIQQSGVNGQFSGAEYLN